MCCDVKRMEERKAAIEKVIQRIDQMLNILEMIAGDLQEISKSLKTLSGQITLAPTLPTTAPTLIPSPMPSRPEKLRSIEDIKMLFPEDLETMLKFEEKEGDIIIKPRQFLGSENFAKIASVVRGAGGEYISAGKESHFRISRETRQIG